MLRILQTKIAGGKSQIMGNAQYSCTSFVQSGRSVLSLRSPRAVPVPVPVRSAALWTVFPPTLSLSLSLSLVRLCDVVGSGRHCSALFVLSQGRGGRDPESEYEREMDSRRLNAQLAHSVRDRFYSETRYARRDGSVSPVRSVAS